MPSKTELIENRIAGAVRGMLGGIAAEGEPLVDFCGNTAGRLLTALSTVAVSPEDVGREAILFFEDGDPARPVLVGLVQTPGVRERRPTGVDVRVDGRCITLQAEYEICLRCGEASITLTRTGKVVVKGASLLSKSTGPNRIKGGSIQLN